MKTLPNLSASDSPGIPYSLPRLQQSTLARLETAGRRIDRQAADLASFWLGRGPDRAGGGFHGGLDRRGKPIPGHAKGVIQQARHAWTWSMWWERRGHRAEAKDAAARACRFLLGHFRDPQDDQFVFMTSPEGEVRDPKKQLYAQAFAIYGLSTFGRVFDDTDALDAAMRCFEAIETRFFDPTFDGYDQSADPGWVRPPAVKDTNTHIHVLEAYTSLLDATSEDRVRARLCAMSRVVAHRLCQPEGYVHQEFQRDWTPVGPRIVSYGHDLETAWLLLDAVRAAGGDGCGDMVRAAIHMATTSANEGFDPEHGGYFHAGELGGKVTDPEKVWWVQAEALAGLFWLLRLTGEVRFLDHFERTLDWIEARQSDHEHGEWFWGVLPDGSLGEAGDRKGDPWKTGYHNVRSMVFVHDWIRDTMAAHA